MRYQCDSCGASIPGQAGGGAPRRCPACGVWERVVPVEEYGDLGEAVCLGRVSTKAQVARRVDLAFPPLNRFFGGGFVVGGTYAIVGEPGCGKSTLFLQALAGLPFRCRYVGAEGESAEDLKERADRCGLDVSNVDYAEADNVVEAILEETPYRVTLYDSLDAGMDGYGSVKAMDAIALNARATQTVAIVVQQVNGKGEAVGPAAKRHRTTANAHLSVLEDETRLLTLDKNRGGRTWVVDDVLIRKGKDRGKTVKVKRPLTLSLDMTERGLVEITGNER